ncbi:hypothetical protein [Cellulosimicrobium funkei]|uniref:hypothetical protein n=1 Tax=Cellulosimicrobium funkei TaxID=264251 RepID=UPI003440467F
MSGRLLDRDVSSTVAVAASADQTWRALLVVLGIDADVPGVSAAYGAMMTGRVRDAVAGDGLVVGVRLGTRTYEISAHLVPRGARCDLTVDATPDVVPASGRGRWRGLADQRRVRRVVRALAADVARAAEADPAGP